MVPFFKLGSIYNPVVDGPHGGPFTISYWSYTVVLVYGYIDLQNNETERSVSTRDDALFRTHNNKYSQ